VEIGSDKFILHLVPSGILSPDALCVIGNGVVVNPLALVEEMEGLEERGISIDSRLRISTRCHLLFNYHCMLDGLQEGSLGKRKIGTTKRGIGPAYGEKAHRTGIRAAELRHPERFEALFRDNAARFNRIFRNAGEAELDIDAEWEKVRVCAERLAPCVADTVLLLNRAADEGKEILFEGAQGMWLDIDYGTYPFVTSSNTTAGAACTGAGLPPSKIDRVLGVAKAYTTRVGSGPFPTELDDAMGEKLREIGAEFGATTGRPRRCGWFDAVATRYSVMVNGAAGIALTKLDVLDKMETLRICTAYDVDGKRVTDMPSDSDGIAKAVPVYEEMPGWMQDTTGIERIEQLPANAKAYIARLMELIGSKLEIVSVGPRRDQTMGVDG
jgi:adenylosuccinate synthase